MTLQERRNSLKSTKVINHKEKWLINLIVSKFKISRQASEWEKMFVIHTCNKTKIINLSIHKILKNQQKENDKPKWKWVKDMKGNSSWDKHFKCLTSLQSERYKLKQFNAIWPPIKLAKIPPSIEMMWEYGNVHKLLERG